jgi:small subunit ribosomal protein S9
MNKQLSNQAHKGIGRRKESIGFVRITGGKGNIIVNDKPFEEYFNHYSLQTKVLEPLKIVNLLGKYDVYAKVKGGGKSAQADSCSLAIAKSLVELNPDLRSTLKRAKLLRRDPRMKERKKYGLKRARKAAQFTKR